MHHVETEKKLSPLSQSETAVAEDPSLALAVNSLESLHEYGQS